MKKSTILFVIIFCSFITKAQLAFQKKDVLVSLGISGGDYRYHKFTDTEKAGRSLPAFLAVEYGANNRFSMGAFAGYYFKKYRFVGNSTTGYNNPHVFKSHYSSFGLRVSYHFTEVLEKKFNDDLNSQDLDMYISGLIGYELNGFTRLEGVALVARSRLVGGAVLGIRYYLNYRLALFGEVGPGIFGLASAGLTARF